MFFIAARIPQWQQIEVEFRRCPTLRKFCPKKGSFKLVFAILSNQTISTVFFYMESVSAILVKILCGYWTSRMLNYCLSNTVPSIRNIYMRTDLFHQIQFILVKTSSIWWIQHYIDQQNYILFTFNIYKIMTLYSSKIITMWFINVLVNAWHWEAE